MFEVQREDGRTEQLTVERVRGDVAVVRSEVDGEPDVWAAFERQGAGWRQVTADLGWYELAAVNGEVPEDLRQDEGEVDEELSAWLDAAAQG